jgi:hypothetical protein
MARSVNFVVSCPKCRTSVSLPLRQIRRNYNLVLTCSECGEVHLAMNAVQLATYEGLKARGVPVGEPPAPQPIEPIRVFPSRDGKTEAVFRRNKTTGETVYTRKVKAPAPAKS